MNRRSPRLVWAALPSLALAFAFGAASACSSDPSSEGTPTPDAATETSTAADGGIDAATSDAPLDAAGDTANEGQAPPFCATYKNLSADASAIEGPRRLYELIALRALVDAMASCEIGTYFGDIEDPPPSLITCFGKQLAMVAGCNLGGAPIDYKNEVDENGVRCVASGGAGNSVHIGFRNPGAVAYGGSDVDHMLDLVRKAALSTGMPAADADVLRALAAALRANVTDAGPDSGYSSSSCL